MENLIKNSETLHTPGPWRQGKYATTVVADHRVEVTAKPNLKGDGGANDSEYYGGNLIAESILREQNAHLIAAAPDMYEILLGLALAEDQSSIDEAIERAHKVLSDLAGKYHG